MKNLNNETYIKNYQNNIAQNFSDALKPFLRWCQFFCAAPLNIKLIPTPLDHVVKRKEKFILYTHVGWCVILLACILTSTYFQYSEFDSNVLTFLTRILYFGEYISGVLNSTIIIFGCHYQRRCYRDYFQRLVDIDLQLHKCGGKINYLQTRRFLRKVMTMYGVFFSCVIATDFMYNRMDGKSFFRSSTVYSIPNVISVLALTEYITLLYSLKERYRHIAEILIVLPKECSWKIDHSQEKLSMLNMVFQHSYHQKTLWMCDLSASEATVETLRQVCLILTELNKDINNSFGVLIITTVVSTFLILSIQFYALYTIMESLQQEDVWLTIYTGLWIILHGGKSFFILYYNNVVNKEKSTLGPTLYRMNFKGKTAKTTMDLCISKFSLQILHEHNHDTACGILKLDLTFVTTIVGALTTYLVILIQFDAASRAPTVPPMDNMTKQRLK